MVPRFRPTHPSSALQQQTGKNFPIFPGAGRSSTLRPASGERESYLLARQVDDSIPLT
jgi:hypothetical protein